ncbi:LysR substrate-binding domain-containing protein [Rhodobacter xanthinilyticus]|uniref:LysR substrate-binding domain-containing protein n=1 Tax=Rhodobacter xanthinilyticus TaxID=1850250 RepID=UPI002E8E1F2A|nr:LysR substrate-binding domain-containing protein [Rhodobacter xanthinilyticus]
MARGHPCHPAFHRAVRPGARARPGREAGPARPADLARAPRLWARTRPNAWADWCARSGCTALEGGAPYEHFYFMLEAASAGLGVALAPEPHVADDLAAGRLIAPFGFLPSGLAYVALRREEAPKKTRTFCDWIGREAAG